MQPASARRHNGPMNASTPITGRCWRLLAFLALMALSACATTPPTGADAASPAWQPRLGQAGKDVMWLPTRDALLQRMLQAAQVGPQDIVYDLGAGDGKIVLAAARDFGARAVGIEYDARLAALAQAKVQQAGLAGRARIVQGDIFETDFSAATVLTLYLLEELNARLRPTILAMRPGTRVVSNTFSMGDWEPDEVITVLGQTAYRWVVPAPVQGRWQLQGWPGGAPAVLELVQQHQRVAGQFTHQGRTQPVLGARIDGDQLQLSVRLPDGRLQPLRLRWQDGQLAGELVPPYGMHDMPPAPQPLQARRLGPD
jgi:Methyltransferase domain